MRADKKLKAGGERGTGPRSKKNVEDGPLTSDTLLAEASTHMGGGQYEKASESLRKLLADAPDHPEGLRLFATLHLKLGSLQVAKNAFESLTHHAFEGKDYSTAESLLREYLAVAPGYVPFLEFLGRILESEGRHDAAAAELIKAAEVLAEDPEQTGRAAELYQKATQLSQGSTLSGSRSFGLAPSSAASPSALFNRDAGAPAPFPWEPSDEPNFSFYPSPSEEKISSLPDVPAGSPPQVEPGTASSPEPAFTEVREPQLLPWELPNGQGPSLTEGTSGAQEDVSLSAQGERVPLPLPWEIPSDTTRSSESFPLPSLEPKSPASCISPLSSAIGAESVDHGDLSYEPALFPWEVSHADSEATVADSPFAIDKTDHEPDLEIASEEVKGTPQPSLDVESSTPDASLSGEYERSHVLHERAWPNGDDSLTQMAAEALAALTEEPTQSPGESKADDRDQGVQSDHSSTPSWPWHEHGEEQESSLTQAAADALASLEGESEKQDLALPHSTQGEVPTRQTPIESHDSVLPWDQLRDVGSQNPDAGPMSTASTVVGDDMPAPVQSLSQVVLDAPTSDTNDDEAFPQAKETRPEAAVPKDSLDRPLASDRSVGEEPDERVWGSSSPDEEAMADAQVWPEILQIQSEHDTPLRAMSPLDEAPQVAGSAVTESAGEDSPNTGDSLEAPGLLPQDLEGSFPAATADFGPVVQEVDDFSLPSMASSPTVQEISSEQQPPVGWGGVEEKAGEREEEIPLVFSPTVPEESTNEEQVSGGIQAESQSLIDTPVQEAPGSLENTDAEPAEPEVGQSVEQASRTLETESLVMEETRTDEKPAYRSFKGTPPIETPGFDPAEPWGTSKDLPRLPSLPPEEAVTMAFTSAEPEAGGSVEPPLFTVDAASPREVESSQVEESPPSPIKSDAPRGTPGLSPPTVSMPVEEVHAPATPSDSEETQVRWRPFDLGVLFPEKKKKNEESAQAAVAHPLPQRVPVLRAPHSTFPTREESERPTGSTAKVTAKDLFPTAGTLRFQCKVLGQKIVSTARGILVFSLLVAGVCGILGLVGIGILSAMWIGVEDAPTNAYHNLATSPQPSILLESQNAYTVLVGIGKRSSMFPIQVKNGKHLHLPGQDTIGDLSPGMEEMRASLSRWFRQEHPSQVFVTEEAQLSEWSVRTGDQLANYRRWTSMQFEDVGFGKIEGPDEVILLVLHRLYVAEGFIRARKDGIARVVGDLEAWRRILGKAKTLRLKILATEAMNDNLAVISGILAQPGLAQQRLPALTRASRPLTHVERSLRWPMHHQFTLEVNSAKEYLTKKRRDTLPWFRRGLTYMPLPLQKVWNGYAAYYEGLVKQDSRLIVDGDPRRGMPHRDVVTRYPARSFTDYLMNPVDNLLVEGPRVVWTDIVGTIIETEARLRLATLLARIRRQPTSLNPLARVAGAGQDYFDPFTGFSMLFNGEKTKLYSVGMDGKDDDGDPETDVTVPLLRKTK